MSSTKSSSDSISVALPVKNTGDLFSKFVHALQQQTLDSNHFELIVVDDTGPDRYDRQIEFLKNASFEFPVYYYQTGLPSSVRSPAVALNIALQRANNSIVFYSRPEVILEKSCLQSHHETHLQVESNEKIANIGKLENRDDQSRSERRNSNPSNIPEDDGRDKFGDPVPEEFDSRNVSINRKWLLEVGGFNEKISGPEANPFLDQEVGLRLLEYGVEFKKDSEAIAFVQRSTQEKTGSSVDSDPEKISRREQKRFRNLRRLHLWLSWTGLVPDPFPWPNTTLLSDRALRRTDEGDLLSLQF